MSRPLSLLLPFLVSCVQSRTSCDDFKGGTFENDTTFGIDQAELDAALGEDGELTADACAELCRSRHWMADVIVSIDECGLAPEGADPTDTTAPPTDPATGDTGGGAGPAAVVYCAWTENAVCEGRAHQAVTSRPEGVGPDAVAAWLARAAHAEAASVKAFVSLAAELERLDAPAELVARARSAARDEVRHARILGRLAGSRGGVPTPLSFGPTTHRTAVALAVENAVEGCVRETWAAMVAHHQAVAAADPEVRSAFAAIAVDEARHGELAQAIDAWLTTRLSAAEVREVEEARFAAVARLLGGLEEPEPALKRVAGLPSVEVARHLAGALLEAVWA